MHEWVIIALIAAPAPLPRPATVLQVEPGEYILHWGGHGRYAMSLNEAKGYNIYPQWRGTWRWDADKRILTVAEWLEDDVVVEWSADLDDRLSGTAIYRSQQFGVRLERVK